MTQNPDAPYWTDSTVDVYTRLEDVEWRSVGIHETLDGFEYRFELPVPLALWDVWAFWERERIHSMRDHLKPGMVLFDVGTEQGWCNLIYADMVGPENMVLIEPTPQFWPNIKATWERNYPNVEPAFCYDGLISDKTNDDVTMAPGWPTCSVGPLIDRNKYQYIHDHSDGIQEMRLDDLVERSGIVPQALTIDVEGAELLVLQSAHSALQNHHPLVWVSIHPDMMMRDYKHHPDQLHAYMAGFGYTGTHLATDHEQHYFFQ